MIYSVSYAQPETSRPIRRFAMVRLSLATASSPEFSKRADKDVERRCGVQMMLSDLTNSPPPVPLQHANCLKLLISSRERFIDGRVLL